MKPKSTNAPRGRPGKGKVVKKELPSDDGYNTAYNMPSSHPKPSVEIVKCISFQKFRYSGENRPGKKYQEKDFMELKLSYLQDKVVRVVIICTDADNRELIHPNGLVGKDCLNGIYDKEYAIRKPIEIIKIPYLRTERIKTKKNELENIRNVLSNRASHLPSPYKERCMSQCTDRYTSGRKFDTTKVCLGVIVTVQSHQGIFNGSLHAISHVVRNASEKTTLAIVKLSEPAVPASTGGKVDIFTSEDGPAIEPTKYIISVSCKTEDDSIDWMSETHYPVKDDIMYKRVITYTIPPLDPNLHITTPIQAMINLECPQSNQYCGFPFTYTPHGEIVVLEEDAFNGHRDALIEQDIKPPTKRRKVELENDGSTEAIKASLKTKIQARQEVPVDIETMYVDSQSDSHGDHYIIRGHQQHQQAYVETIPGRPPVFIRHQDPQTGESSVFLDMDASKSDQSSNGSIVVERDASQYAFHMRERRKKGSPFESHSQDVVVAAGYSEDVPPNTTVYIYTTNGGLGERMAIDATTGEHLVIREVSEEEPMQNLRQVARRGEKVIAYDGENARVVALQNGASEQVIRREPVTEKRIIVSQASAVSNNDISIVENERGAIHSFAEGICTSVLRHLGSPHSQSASDVNISASPSNTVSNQYSPVPSSSPSVIPPIRRMLVSNKTMPSASPWAVETPENTENEYDIVVKGYPFDSYDKKTVSTQMSTVKREPLDEESFNHMGENLGSSSSSTTFTRPRYIASKQLHQFENEPIVVTSSQTVVTSTPVTLETSMPSQDIVVTSSGSTSLESMPINVAAAMMAATLPTDDIFKIAENFQSVGLPSSTEELTASTESNNSN